LFQGALVGTRASELVRKAASRPVWERA